MTEPNGLPKIHPAGRGRTFLAMVGQILSHPRLSPRIILGALLWLSAPLRAEVPLIGMTTAQTRGIATAEAGIVADRIRSELVKSGQVRLVEREAVDRVLKEQAFQGSGACGEDCSARIGRMLAAQSMLIPSIQCGEDRCTLSARLVDVGSGEVVVSVDQDCPTGSMEELLSQGVPGLVGKLLAGTRSAPSLQATGEIHVEVDDPTAELRLDGKTVPGEGAFALEGISPGTHLLEARTRDRMARREVRLAPGQILRVRLELQPGTGHAMLLSRPLGAQVFLRELLVGETPQKSLELPAGWQSLTFRKLGYLDTTLTVPVAMDSVRRVHVQLVPAGTLVLEPLVEAPARLWQAGEPLVRDASERISLRTGRWHLKLEAPGYLAVDQEIEIKPSRTTTVTLEALPQTDR